MSQQWYVRTSQGKAGPFDPATLRQLAERGKITPESRVSLDGRNWVPASRVKGLAFAETGAAEPPSPPQSAEPPADHEYALAQDDRPDSTSDRPSGSPRRGFTAAEVALLHRSSGDTEEDLPALSSAAGLPLRFGLSFGLASTAAAGAALLVKSAWFLGIVDLDTIGASLAVRVGLPAIAFVVVFALIFWYSGREVEPPQITAEMSDEEIAKALKRY